MISKLVLKQVIADNAQFLRQLELFERDFELVDFDCLVLTGIRRCGKSYSLFREIKKLLKKGYDFSDILYVNFEDERLDNIQVSELNLLLEAHQEMYGKNNPILFLDEIQTVEGWQKFARRMADTKHKILITGSNAKMLSSDIASTLGGRYISLEIFPYSFKEYLSVNNIKITDKDFYSLDKRTKIEAFLKEYFYFGGFPEVTFIKSKRLYLNSLYQKIFLNDIIIRNKIENIAALKLLLKKIAESIKQPITYTRLKNIVSSMNGKIGTSTVVKYIQALTDSFLIIPIKNYQSSLMLSETAPKYYFVDNGILNLLIFNPEPSLLENICAVYFVRKFGKENVFFYKENIEVDFVLPEVGSAYQVSYNLREGDTLKRETVALVKFHRHFGGFKNFFIVTYDQEETLICEGLEIKIISLQNFLLEKSK